jgi:hypothetical protein
MFGVGRILVAVLFVLLVFSAALWKTLRSGGHGRTLAPRSQKIQVWTPFNPSNGGFRLRTPAPMQGRMLVFFTDDLWPPVEGMTFEARSQAGMFSVNEVHFTEGVHPHMTAERLAQLTHEHILKTTAGVLQSERPLNLNGATAWHMQFSVMEGGRPVPRVIRALVAGRSLYILTVSGANASDTERFLEGFVPMRSLESFHPPCLYPAREGTETEILKTWGDRNVDTTGRGDEALMIRSPL